MVSRLWMICYDIADDNRRSAVVRLLEAQGERVQYSLFECFLNGEQLDRLLREIAQVIDQQENRLAAYPLCRWCKNKVQWQGLGHKPDDPAYFQV